MTVSAVVPGSLDEVLDFELPDEFEAAPPAELRGLRRDGVRMLVAHRAGGRIEHARFADLPRHLEPGDLVVINTSGTLPASLPAVRPDGELVRLHLSTRLPGGLWTVELRRDPGPEDRSERSRPVLEGPYSETLRLPAGARAEILAPYGAEPDEPARLRLATLRVPGGDVLAYLDVHGEAIRYCYTRDPYPIDFYQTVYATTRGSAEMPSAGRAFTPELITALIARGISIAPLLLHTGVSSQEAGEPPYEEQYRVPRSTADAVNSARARGGRVIAVGTTVVRALETVADGGGVAHPGEGWTDLVVTPERGVAVVDGIITGWHEPRASHLALVETIAGRELLVRSYQTAISERYLWHEFGDTHLVLP